jgi:hypothetical protein
MFRGMRDAEVNIRCVKSVFTIAEDSRDSKEHWRGGIPTLVASFPRT